MDYLDYFGLTAEPFTHAPVSRFYYASRQHTDALKRLMYAAQTMKGLAILVGDIGHGKTTLARRLLDSLPPSEFEAAMLVVVHAGITPSWLLKRIATQLGVPEPADDKLTILSQVYARLVEIHESGKRAVVIIDEAQMLDTREVMEEFRGLLNLEVPGHKLISFVFFGLPDIERNLHLDAPLRQRVALRFHLEPLGVDDTKAYVEHRLRLAGCKEELFPRDALAAVHAQTRGVPRVINTLCDNVLLEMFFAKLAVASPQLVTSVAENLGLNAPAPLPSPPAAVASEPPVSPTAGGDAIVAVARVGRAPASTPASAEPVLDPHAIAARVASERPPAEEREPGQPGRHAAARAASPRAGGAPAPSGSDEELEAALSAAEGAPELGAELSAYAPAADVASIKPRLVVPAPQGFGPGVAGGIPDEPEPELDLELEDVAGGAIPPSHAAPTAAAAPQPAPQPATLAAALAGSVAPGTRPPPRTAPKATPVKTSSGTIDLSEIDDLLADLKL